MALNVIRGSAFQSNAYPTLTFATPFDFVAAIQERLGLPRTGVWDGPFTTAVIARLNTRADMAQKAALLSAAALDRRAIGESDATAAAWVIADPNLGAATVTPPAVDFVTVEGWTPFAFGGVAPRVDNPIRGSYTPPGFFGTTTGKVALVAGGLALAYWLFSKD